MAGDRRDPLKDLAQLQDKMNRIFEDSFSLLRTGEGKELFALGSWVPPVDIYETEDTIVLSAELPGMKKEDMSVEIKDNTLTIKGERKFEHESEAKNYSRIERSYGTFQRVFTLAHLVQQDKIKARYENGILEIILPKAEESKTRHIKVKVE
ncbi:MAG: Hsp20/alpha crystallin family protein [Proteobacteria bacterium]|nr:Hsp20/alpha crystallin family protein [Pseudomonadota bacterium]